MRTNLEIIAPTVEEAIEKGLADLNEKNEVIIDCKNNQTSVPGLFAAGDSSSVLYKQIIVAAGEGAKAALSAHNYLNNLK